MTTYLDRYMPVLRYDSREWCYADSADLMLSMPGIKLRRGPPANTPIADESTLSLAFLAAKTYPDGKPVEKTDVLSVRGAGKDYRKQYDTFTDTHPEHRDRIYGRAFPYSNPTWLLYCMAFFYNRGPFGISSHELDWEFVLIRITDGLPDTIAVSQHRTGARTAWAHVETTAAGHPVIYVARGSHAGYFRPGWHRWGLDRADGKVTRPVTLESFPPRAPAWTAWPGYWGGTLAADTGADQSSPRGPGPHKLWRNPAAFLDATTHWTP